MGLSSFNTTFCVISSHSLFIWCWLIGTKAPEVLNDESPIHPRSCILSIHENGCLALSHESPTKKPVYIHLLYANRAFEWLHLRQLFFDCLIALHLDTHLELLRDIIFAWSYQPPVRYSTYKPRAVFCNFDTSTLGVCMDPCICHIHRF